MSSNQALIDALTLRQIFIERYSKGEAARLVKYLDRLSAQLQQAVGSYDQARAFYLAQQVSQITQTLLDEYGEDLYKGLERFAQAEAEFAQQAILSSTAASSVSPPTINQIRAAITQSPMRLIAGKAVTELTIDQAAKQFSTKKAQQVAQIVRDGATIGKTSQELVSEITNLVDIRTKQQAASLVRTATNHIGNEARSMTYAANDDVIIGEEYVATLDANTTITCASLDGKVFPIGEGPTPPSHWGCRSVRTPVINPEYNLGSEITGERASADGPVSAQTTYGGWLKRQSDAVQDEVLGVERAKLFRSGKLSIGKFTDDTGKVYTLEELKRLNPLAFGGKVETPKPKVVVGAAVGGENSGKYSQILSAAHESHVALMVKLPQPKAIKVGKNQSHYTAYNKTITADISRGEGSILVHEYGHHVDYQLGGGYIPISATDDAFGAAYASDRKSLGLHSRSTKFESMESLRDEFFDFVEKGKGSLSWQDLEPKAIASPYMSDIVDSLSQGSFQKLYGVNGHGETYYKDKINRHTEIFANLFYIKNTDSWERARELFPELTKRFDELIDEALQ